jgi:hypothetical protein
LLSILPARAQEIVQSLAGGAVSAAGASRAEILPLAAATAGLPAGAAPLPLEPAIDSGAPVELVEP